MRSLIAKLLIMALFLAGSAIAQESVYGAKVSGLSVQGMFTSGKNYRSRGIGVMFLNKGKFFMGYEQDKVEVWTDEDFSNYSIKDEIALYGLHIGFRNYEAANEKRFFSATFQTGLVFSSEVNGIHMIPIAMTIFKSLSADRVKIIPLIYGLYVYIFNRNVYGSEVGVSTTYTYGLQMNVALRPLSCFTHAIVLGLDWNLRNRDVPLSFQISLAFNAFKKAEQ